MMRERLIALVNHVCKTSSFHKEFAEQTGIDRKKIKNLMDGNQRFNEDHITAITKAFPQYKIWFALGETYPDIGQTSPELEAISKEFPQEKAG